MSLSKLRDLGYFLFGVDKRERVKVFFLSLSFFSVIGAYTIAKELKDSVFCSIVGKSYLPWAKLLTIIFLIPAILGYAKLVDKLRRYHLLYFFSLLYGFLFLIFAYFLGNPTIGLLNTDTGPWRILGWAFYLCVESFSPFLVSVFWAFANSVTDPNAAKKNYTIIIAGSKLGGICAAIFALWILGMKSVHGQGVADVANHQNLLLFSASILLIVPFFVRLMMKRVPGRDLHGYEAAYVVEKKRAHEHSQEEREITKKSIFQRLLFKFKDIFAGLIFLFKYPYMLGVFGMIFFYEVINVVFGYARLGVGQQCSDSISGFTSYLLTQAMYTHAVGLGIVLFGSRTLVSLWGERRCLLLVPIVTGILLVYYLTAQSAAAVAVVYVLLRSINYAFANPLREVLYIPTVKEMKFKARSWIDAFGGRSAKASGSVYNLIAGLVGEGSIGMLNAVFFTIVIGLWTLNAFFIGRRFEQAIKNNEVIGAEPKPLEH